MSVRTRGALLLLLALALGGAAAGGGEQLWVRKPRSRSAFIVDDDGLAALCERNGLKLVEMRQVAEGRRRNCRGWSCGPVERFMEEEVEAGEGEEEPGSADTAVISDLFGERADEATAAGEARAADALASTSPPPTVSAADEEEEEEEDDEHASAVSLDEDAEEEDEDDDDDESKALQGGRGSALGSAIGSGTGSSIRAGTATLVAMLKSGQAIPAVISPLTTLALALAPKHLSRNLSLARTAFYCYVVTFFAMTALVQNSIALLPDTVSDESEEEGGGTEGEDEDGDEEEARKPASAPGVRLVKPPSPAAAMQAALGGGGGRNPFMTAPPGSEAGEGAEEAEEVVEVLSLRAYDASELSKLRSAVWSGVVLNAVLSLVMKQKGARLAYH
jgi:hypothetical protein